MSQKPPSPAAALPATTRHTSRRLASTLCLLAALGGAVAAAPAGELQVGFGTADITPDVDGPQPVWMAGQESNRRATAVHDRLEARASVVVADGRKVALVCVDLIGLQYPAVQAIRAQLADFSYVLVSSTHNHEGPDVVGIWGPAPDRSGVAPGYVEFVVAQVVAAVRAAEGALVPARARYGQASDPELLADYRLPEVLDSVARVVAFRRVDDDRPCGLWVQWNSHPVEPDGNHALTRDFIGYAVDKLRADFECPVVYFSGAVGGLMGTPTKKFRDPQGRHLAKDVFDFMRLYGEAVAELADRAVDSAEPTELAPLVVSTGEISVPLDNAGYRQARAAGVLTRPAVTWSGDAEAAGEPVAASQLEGPQAVRSEVAYLRLGELHLAAIPGEIYPELVYGETPPTEAGVDFPDALPETPVMRLLPGPKTLLIGLANDELGYIIPERQWDVAAPYAYGRKSPQYGERNSLGPRTARVLLEALARRVAETGQPERP